MENNQHTTVIPTPTDMKSDLPPIEAALAISHIFEQILSLLSKHDLLTCRLVSTHWNLASSAQLKKEVKFEFFDYNFGSSKGKKSLADLTKVLEHSNNFPCNKFTFIKTFKFSSHTLRDEVLQNFLDIYGADIEDLTVNFPHESNTQLPDEEEVMEQIKNLLVFQSPNLHSFSLRVASAFDWQQRSRGSSSIKPLETTDAEFQKIVSQVESLGIKNTSLKVIHLWGEISSKVMEMMIQLAPNLEEIILKEFNYRYLLQPLNRVYLLKKLIVNPYKYGIEDLEKLALASRQGNLRPQLKQITFKFQVQQNDADNDNNNGNGNENGDGGEENENFNPNMNAHILPSELDGRIAKVMSEFLHLSSHSLKTIVWHGVALLPGMKWPQIMPELETIEMGNPREVRGSRLFPNGFNWATTFPKVRNVNLCDDSGEMGFPADYNFVTSFNFDPVYTVKNVKIFNYSGKELPSEHLELISTLFVGAQVAQPRSAQNLRAGTLRAAPVFSNLVGRHLVSAAEKSLAQIKKL